MEEDFTENITSLIEHKLIEANIKVDSYISAIEEINITPFGRYFIEHLIHFFTYLDLVCTDCDLYDEQTTNFIARSANDEYKLFSKGNRGYRMIKRVEKTNQFVKYLIDQEKSEIQQFNLNRDYIVTDDIVKNYNKDIEQLKVSALRQFYSSNEEQDDLKQFFNNLKSL